MIKAISLFSVWGQDSLGIQNAGVELVLFRYGKGSLHIY